MHDDGKGDGMSIAATDRLAGEDAAGEDRALAARIGILRSYRKCRGAVITAPSVGNAAGWIANPRFQVVLGERAGGSDWRIQFVDDHGRHYCEDPEGVKRNDIGVAPLGRGNLRTLPSWLARLERDHGVRFDFSRSHATCGRGREPGRALTGWLSRKTRG